MSLAYSGRQHGILVNLLAPNASTTISAGNPEPNLAGSLPPGLGAALAPLRLTEAVAPFAAYLVSRACSLSGETFTAGMGHFARVFVGSARGWAAPDPAGITIDDIAGHIEEIRDLEAHRVPESLYDDVEAIAETIGLNYG